MDELKPCPFCGSENAPCPVVADLDNFKFKTGHQILCNQYVGGCNAMTWAYETLEKAIAAWNRRADDNCQEGVCPL